VGKQCKLHHTITFISKLGFGKANNHCKGIEEEKKFFMLVIASDGYFHIGMCLECGIRRNPSILEFTLVKIN
jgi:hypothetical protein